MNSITDLKEYLQIDKFSLDTDIERQAHFFHRVAEITTAAIDARDHAKNDLATIEAEINTDYRTGHLEDKVKFTEKSLDSEVHLTEDYQNAYKHFLHCKMKADEALALKEAFIQRGFMLRELASLYVSGYFAEFSTKSTDDKDELDSANRRQKVSEKRRPLRTRERKTAKD